MAVVTGMILVIIFALNRVLRCLQVSQAQPQKQSWRWLVLASGTVMQCEPLTQVLLVSAVCERGVRVQQISTSPYECWATSYFLRKVCFKEIYSIWGRMALTSLGCRRVKVLCVSRILTSLKILSVTSSTSWLPNFECN